MVAGVDGSAEALAAARNAGAAAAMRGSDLLLVHALLPRPVRAHEMVAALSASRTAAEELVAPWPRSWSFPEHGDGGECQDRVEPE